MLRLQSFFLFFFLFGYQFALAEKDYTLELDHTFHPEVASRYNKLKVLDMRADKDNIGYLETGAFNRIATVRTKGPLDQTLSLYFNDIEAGNKKGDDELLLVLRQIKIEDRPNGEEIGTLYFDGDFFGGKNGEYKFIGTLDTLIEVNAGMDVSKRLIEMVKFQIPSILTKYASLAPTDNARALSEAAAGEKHKQEKLSHPIYKTEDFKKGIYYTVEQFLANEPVDSPFVKDVFLLQGGNSSRKVINLYYPNKKGKKGEKIKDEDFFAVYDGKTWYLSSNPYCITMYYKEGDFYAYKSFKGLASNDGAIVAGVLAGGVIGGAIAGGIAGSGNRNVWTVYYSRFDPVTKTFKPVTRK